MVIIIIIITIIIIIMITSFQTYTLWSTISLSYSKTQYLGNYKNYIT